MKSSGQRDRLTLAGERANPSAGGQMGEEEEEEIRYRLTLIGSLPVHHLTTMAMLPWVVAEIGRSQPGERELGAGSRSGGSGGKQLDVPARNQPVSLCVSASRVQCVCIGAEGVAWDPLSHTVLFECRPHRVTKLIHNSQEPSSFGCLVRDTHHCACYVFQCRDCTKVPEIISTLRQAGKSSARNDDITNTTNKVSTSSGGSTASETCLSFTTVSTTTTSAAPTTVVSPTAFAKKFEVLFCGRVSVAHKNAPPALIDECIEKFGQSHVSGVGGKGGSGGGLVGGLRRVLTFQSNGLGSGGVGNGATESPPTGKRPILFKRDPSFPCLQALDENGLSPEISNAKTGDTNTHTSGVQPTSLQENRTMLFTVGRSQIFLVSPDTKKVAIEKSFREISFCSQGIRHVDHFGFICRETVEGGSCHFVCYVFQCTDESLVDEIMLTLKQAFSVAALQQSAKTQSQQCDSCPMQQLHRLCERIEGLHPCKTKLELQRHLATLDNQEQASVFENTMRARPKNDQEENELVMASLRNLYEERQRSHQHTQPGDSKRVNEEAAPGPVEVQQQSSSRQRLEQFKTRAKRSLTESLEGIWKGSNKAKTQRENSEGGDSCSSTSTVNSSQDQPSLDDPLPASSPLQPTSPLRCHNSTGDLKRLDTSPSVSSSSLSPSRDTQQQGFRRRASTFSHPPTPSSSDSSPALIFTHTPQDAAATTKPKLVRHYSVSTDTPHQSNDVAALTPIGESPLRSHRHSWRQQIFLRVATPQKNSDSSERGDSCLEAGRVCGSPVGGGGGVDVSLRVLPEERKRKSKEELRELWRKAILQQILLLRMEKENQKLQASESNLQNRRLKLDYEEITPCLKEVTLVWEKMLGTPGRAKIKFDTETIHAAVAQGVPRHHRGEIWKFLSEQYLLRQTVPSRPPANHAPYKELLKQLTSQQHAILIDLGRTFPTHPYFQAQLGAGQLSLYNLLKAYSLLDPEVGYCQGLSFIAGVLLLHMGEEDAFNMLKFLMYDMGLRKQYRPDMIILQIQMYQLSRLLHDYHRDLYSHLEQQEIGPSLYATPWFLTAFASHFPLGFVARVFDMLFLQGAEVIFKVALSLLGSHKPLILQHDSLESIVDFIKTTLPNLGLVQMEKTINQVCEMDVSKQLQAYEVEYHVLQDELLDTPTTLNQSQRAAQLERTNQSLRQQNLDLLEELQVSHARVCSLESQVEVLVQSEGRLREQASALEEEKRQLQSTVTHLHDILTSLGIHISLDAHPLTHTPPPDRHTVTAAAKVEGKEVAGNGTAATVPHPPACPEDS
ncbi:TBC1 domain family member 1 isoform X2 [Myripristis murdjan]|uniref:TBC1 domain family member 1 isoform X2 n=1 Tax=Myripristis murdjan TaxID=586833 RepID=UPI001176185E|nr:TBC1 domain family member 1 isoform X2 [Myripristis murdjan]XP_029914687.1 TBC1 domain family member 1 isoform X2 [Myripristis murdjan]XP_029914695.1 TBC1 domain family member 1 isoform X2 [Myripristis murdjan]XP_029914703.1 TBC1 domain family member 1 isoform X2 [Myripristis murdjan]XP_029914713.1 TBC1 domain family member 1 isoform X2 [Myripristis murdjan]